MSALWTLGMIGYALEFAFCERTGFPPKSLLTCFRKTADEVIECLDAVGREHLYDIQLTNIEELNHEHRPKTSTSSSPSGH